MDITLQKQLEQGQALYLAGHYEKAISFAQKYLKKHSTDLAMLRLLSACYFNLKDTSHAIETTEKIITIEPIQAEDLFNLCHLYCLSKQYEKAEAICLKGLVLSPNNPLGLKNLSAAYLHQDKKKEAEEILNLLITNFSQHADANDHINLASLLSQKTELTRIIKLILLALKKEPTHQVALCMLITTAMKHNEHYLVIAAIEKLLSFEREKLTKETSLALATALFDMGYLSQAIVMYKHTLQLVENKRTRASYGMVLLSTGQYEQGWHEYLTRLALPEVGYAQHKLKSKLWHGENLNKKTLLIVHEQGFGDTIQFVRFIFPLKKKYKVTTIFKSQVPLASLMNCIPGIDQIITKNDPVPRHDYHITVMSLPYYLRIFSQEQLLSEPYINIDPNLVKHWQALTAASGSLKIGFCWRGSKAHVLTARRDCSLNPFLFLCRYQNILAVSLQKEVTTEERAILQHFNIVNAGVAVNELSDTAAVITQLDLIICIDTVIAHLAGAMGKKVWLLLPFQTEWRHLRGIAKSPWYKDMSFIRQPTLGDWDSVFKQIEKNLQAYMQLNL